MFQKNYQWYPKIVDGAQNHGQSGFGAIFWIPKMMKIDHSIKCVRKFGYHLGTILGTIWVPFDILGTIGVPFWVPL